MAQILDLRTEWQIDIGVMEKDYVLGWLLAGIAQPSSASGAHLDIQGRRLPSQVLLRDLRFFEDSDFTIIARRARGPGDLGVDLRRDGRLVSEASGIELASTTQRSRRRQNLRGSPTTSWADVSYPGPRRRSNVFPR